MPSASPSPTSPSGSPATSTPSPTRTTSPWWRCTARLQHEFNYGDAGLAKRGLERLDIDPRNIAQGWCIDFCAQALREIIIGLGSDMDGFMMKSGFQITVSSEIMAILAVASDLKDMRERMGRIVVAYSKSGQTRDHA